MPVKYAPVRKFSEQAALRAIARLVVAYGDNRVSDPGAMKLLSREWANSFAYFEEHEIHQALDRIIPKSKFWPTIAEVTELLRQDMAPAPMLQTFRAAKEPDLTPEEISRRAAVIAEAKRKYGYSPALDAWDDNNKPQKADTGPFVVEVSDLSDALRELVAKQNRR